MCPAASFLRYSRTGATRPFALSSPQSIIYNYHIPRVNVLYHGDSRDVASVYDVATRCNIDSNTQLSLVDGCVDDRSDASKILEPNALFPCRISRKKQATPTNYH